MKTFAICLVLALVVSAVSGKVTKDDLKLLAESQLKEICNILNNAVDERDGRRRGLDICGQLDKDGLIEYIKTHSLFPLGLHLSQLEESELRRICNDLLKRVDNDGFSRGFNACDALDEDGLIIRILGNPLYNLPTVFLEEESDETYSFLSNLSEADLNKYCKAARWKHTFETGFAMGLGVCEDMSRADKIENINGLLNSLEDSSIESLTTFIEEGEFLMSLSDEELVKYCNAARRKHDLETGFYSGLDTCPMMDKHDKIVSIFSSLSGLSNGTVNSLKVYIDQEESLNHLQGLSEEELTRYCNAAQFKHGMETGFFMGHGTCSSKTKVEKIEFILRKLSDLSDKSAESLQVIAEADEENINYLRSLDDKQLIKFCKASRAQKDEETGFYGGLFTCDSMTKIQKIEHILSNVSVLKRRSIASLERRVAQDIDLFELF